MIHLIDIDESNWLAAAHLSVASDQRGYVDDGAPDSVNLMLYFD